MHKCTLIHSHRYNCRSIRLVRISNPYFSFNYVDIILNVDKDHIQKTALFCVTRNIVIKLIYAHFSKIMLFIGIYVRATIILSNDIPQWSLPIRKSHEDHLMRQCLMIILLRFATMSDNVLVLQECLNILLF
jgi:hypothetical protein